MTSFSLMCLEGFFATKLVGSINQWDRLEAKVIDAWQLLDEELRKEEQND